jgi:hypothetical protein
LIQPDFFFFLKVLFFSGRSRDDSDALEVIGWIGSVNSEYDLMQAMTDYVQEAEEKIRRIDRRIRNEPDADCGESFGLLSRKLVSTEQVEALRRSLWGLVVSVNQAYSSVSYWRDYVEPLRDRVHLYDEDGKE